MIWRIYSDRAALTNGCAAALATDLRSTLQTKGGASLALPGGTTPAPVFQALAQVPLDWSRITVFAGDERAVSASSPRSNTGQIARHLCHGLGAAAHHIALDPPASGRWAAHAVGRLGPHLPPDVVLLGMGEDAHIASLFPGCKGLDATDPLVETTAPDGEARLSLGPGPLQAAGHVHLLITGATKRACLQAARAKPAALAPVRLVLDRAIIHWAE
jgi:6-phosphogluconolactonase